MEPDGAQLALASNRRDGASVDVYLVDIASGAWRMVAEQRGIGTIADISRDGRFVVVDRLANRGDNNLILVDLSSRAEVLLTPHTGTATFEGGRFAPDGRTLYLS